MAFFMLKPSADVQDEHILYEDDMRNLEFLEQVLDPRVVHYCEILRAHKRICPICSWPRMYPIWRRLCQVCTKIFRRKVF